MIYKFIALPIYYLLKKKRGECVPLWFNPAVGMMDGCEGVYTSIGWNLRYATISYLIYDLLSGGPMLNPYEYKENYS